MNRHFSILKKPASWYGEMWREALPLGNGLTGVLIPGAIAEENIQFNRHDLWHSPKPDMPIPNIRDTFYEMRRFIDANDYGAANHDNFMHALQEKGYQAQCETPYPFGWLDMTFTPEAPFSHYRRGINLKTGEAFVRFTVDGTEFCRQAFVSRADDITVIRMSAQNPFSVTYDFRLYEKIGQTVTEPLEMRRTSVDGTTAVSVAFVGDIRTTVQNQKLTVTGRDYLILVRCSSHGSSVDLQDFLTSDYNTLLTAHTKLHTPLYDSVSIQLSDDHDHLLTNDEMLDQAYESNASPALLERLWRFGRYLFLSAASDSGNPVPLYGLWHGDANLQWSQYVANENVEMTYWHALPGNLAFSIPPLLRYYSSRIPLFQECAKQMFGMNGIWISAYTTPNVGGPTVPVSVIGNWISAAGWLCRHFWEYYCYTHDQKLLRDEILPFMHEAALFYKDYVVLENDRIRLYPSVSPENTPGNLMMLDTCSASGHHCPTVENATMDFAVMKELIQNLLLGIEVTGLYQDEASDFINLLKRIPDYQINQDGAVKEWMHPELEDNYHHRHLSHIYPIFPGNEVSAHSNPTLFKAFQKAVMLRKLGSQSGWSLTHMACIYARLGEAEKAAECLDVMAKSVILNSLMTVHNDWRNMGMTLNWKEAPIQLDAAFGSVNAIQEMLFRFEKDALSILPALPKRLTHGHVRGITFPSGTIDFDWNASGQIKLQIHANRDLDTSIIIQGQFRQRIHLAANTTYKHDYIR